MQLLLRLQQVFHFMQMVAVSSLRSNRYVTKKSVLPSFNRFSCSLASISNNNEVRGNQDAFQLLWQTVQSRAKRNLSNRHTIINEEEPTIYQTASSRRNAGNPDIPMDKTEEINSLLGDAIKRARHTLETKIPPTTQQNDDDFEKSTKNSESSSSTVTAEEVNATYGSNPTITVTALAQLLWKQVLRPDVDTAIDATCGNGHDSLALAKILFPSSTSTADVTGQNLLSQAQLICIDIQERACRNTRTKLSQLLPSHVLEQNVCIFQTSHASIAPLLDTNNRNKTQIALVVYNLGFLPNSDKEQQTTTKTTLESLTDAAVLLRIGGMISVVTYPRSNPEEDRAVRAFFEGLALFSCSTDTVSWQDPALNLAADDVVQHILCALRNVLNAVGAQQTWRVHEHRKLGWIDAPVLLTATRIK